MEVYFTSPILGRIYGLATTENHETYLFKGQKVLINIEICRDGTGWICPKDQWLHDFQVNEIGMQIDNLEKWLSAN